MSTILRWLDQLIDPPGFMMSIIVNIHEAKTHLVRLVDQAHAGQEIILTKYGEPHARIVPLAADVRRRMPGRLKGRVCDEFCDPLPDEELAPWNA